MKCPYLQPRAHVVQEGLGSVKPGCRVLDERPNAELLEQGPHCFGHPLPATGALSCRRLSAASSPSSLSGLAAASLAAAPLGLFHAALLLCGLNTLAGRLREEGADFLTIFVEGGVTPADQRLLQKAAAGPAPLTPP